MNGFSLVEGAEQFEIACEFDELPAVRGAAGTSWALAAGGVGDAHRITGSFDGRQPALGRYAAPCR